MKKRLRLTAIFAGAVWMCSVLPVTPASALWYWGTASGEEFQDMELLDTKGMFGDADLYTYHYVHEGEELVHNRVTGEEYLRPYHYEGDSLYLVKPRKNSIQFVLREGLDEEWAEKAVFEILDKYYPELSTQYVIGATGPAWETTASKTYNGYQIWDNSEMSGSAEIAEGIMRELAAAGLITRFYSWGQTADYQNISIDHMNTYHTTYTRWNSTFTELEEVEWDVDWNDVGEWVAMHHPECEFVYVTPDEEDAELLTRIGYYDTYDQKSTLKKPVYAVVSPDDSTFPERFAVYAELYAQFGLSNVYSSPEYAYEALIGQNALAVEGDLNVDCQVDISDAVLLARMIAEDDTMPAICDTGYLNADVDSDGLLTILDVTALLEVLAE